MAAKWWPKRTNELVGWKSLPSFTATAGVILPSSSLRTLAARKLP